MENNGIRKFFSDSDETTVWFLVFVLHLVSIAALGDTNVTVTKS